MKPGDVYKIVSKGSVLCYASIEAAQLHIEERIRTRRFTDIESHGYIVVYTGVKNQPYYFMKSIASGEISLWTDADIERGLLEKAE